jgi:hypothetical protein
MSEREIAEAAMELPEKDRLTLARRIVASIAAEQESIGDIAQAGLLSAMDSFLGTLPAVCFWRRGNAAHLEQTGADPV